MRRFVCLFVMVFVPFFSVVSHAAPDLQVDELSYDFGEVFQGEQVLHVFEFSNSGDQDLVIDRVKSSCGCTAALLSEKVIVPGGKGEIKASFDSSRFRNAVSKTIYLYSNDPVAPVMQLHIKGTVLEKVAVEPSQINFGNISADKLVQATVVLRNHSDEVLNLGEPASTAAELTVTLSQGPFASGADVEMTINFTPKPGVSRFSGYVLIPVKGVPRNELRIPVYATIQ